MSDRVRLVLLVGCALIAALSAPRAALLFGQGLVGPYSQERAQLPSEVPIASLGALLGPALAFPAASRGPRASMLLGLEIGGLAITTPGPLAGVDH